MDGSAAPDVTLQRLHEIADPFARCDIDAIVKHRRCEMAPHPRIHLRQPRRLIVMKDTCIKVVG